MARVFSVISFASLDSSRFNVVAADIDENRSSAAQYEGVDRGNESESWNDHFIAGADVEEDCSHLERVRTTGSQQSFGRAQQTLEERVALLRETLIACDLTDQHRLGDVAELLAD